MPHESNVSQSAVAKAKPSFRGVMVLVLIAAVLVQAGFLMLAVRTTGRIDGFALRSIDSHEFMRLARTLARHGVFSQDEGPPFRPDTWRGPVYPLFLAACIGLFGDNMVAVVLAQQLLALCSVSLLVVTAAQWMSPRRAGIVGILWVLDPYRGYYTLWILSETCFALFLLVAIRVWQYQRTARTPLVAAFTLGLAAGTTVLVRPIGVALIPLALCGAALAPSRGRTWLARLVACLVGVSVTVGSWMGRNKVVAGDFALSHVTGPVLTYFKVKEVLLWAQGQTSKRYDDAVTQRLWEQFDRQIRDRWVRTYGPLSPQARQELVWSEITTGRVRAVNSLLLDRDTMQVGLAILKEHPWATATCWAARCVSILTFPLNLAIWPPDTTSAFPFAVLLPDVSLSARRAFGALLALPYVVLSIMAAWRAIRLLSARQWSVVFTCWAPALALLLAASPQEDPRFRLPMIPLLLIVAGMGRESPTDVAGQSADHGR